MDFRPVEYDPAVNLGRTHPLREFFTLVAGIGILLVCTYFALGLFVDFVADSISVEQEQNLWAGYAPAPELFGLGKKVPEDALADMQARVDGIVEKVPATVFEQLPPYDFRYQVVANDQINAMAVPGGTIIIFSGLVQAAKTDAELAFVIGHELGHFAGRDHLRTLGRGLLFGILSAAVLGTDSSLTNLAAGLHVTLAAQHSQGQEFAADDWGAEILTATFGDAQGAVDFFSGLQSRSAEDKRWLPFLSTHPHTEDRIARVQEGSVEK